MFSILHLITAGSELMSFVHDLFLTLPEIYAKKAPAKLPVSSFASGSTITVRNRCRMPATTAQLDAGTSARTAAHGRPCTRTSWTTSKPPALRHTPALPRPPQSCPQPQVSMPLMHPHVRSATCSGYARQVAASLRPTFQLKQNCWQFLPVGPCLRIRHSSLT